MAEGAALAVIGGATACSTGSQGNTEIPTARPSASPTGEHQTSPAGLTSVDQLVRDKKQKVGQYVVVGPVDSS